MARFEFPVEPASDAVECEIHIVVKTLNDRGEAFLLRLFELLLGFLQSFSIE